MSLCWMSLCWVTRFFILMLNVIMLRDALFYSYAECHYAECRYADCHYAECRYANCRYAECRSALLRLRYIIIFKTSFWRWQRIKGDRIQSWLSGRERHRETDRQKGRQTDIFWSHEIQTNGSALAWKRTCCKIDCCKTNGLISHPHTIYCRVHLSTK